MVCIGVHYCTFHNNFPTVLSIIDTVDTCTQKNSRIGELYSGSPLGIAVCVLSLSTNLLATLFVGYKAWYEMIVNRVSRYPFVLM